LINERKKKMLKVQFHAHEIIINSFWLMHVFLAWSLLNQLVNNKMKNKKHFNYARDSDSVDNNKNVCLMSEKKKVHNN
jgi:ABC-type uncharacterized transport system permease subunit